VHAVAQTAGTSAAVEDGGVAVGVGSGRGDYFENVGIEMGTAVGGVVVARFRGNGNGGIRRH
jgi:hypothetical protein